MKQSKHPVISGVIFVVSIYILLYIFEIGYVDLIEPLLKTAGVRFEGIVPPGPLLRAVFFFAAFLFVSIIIPIFFKTKFLSMWLIGYPVSFLCYLMYTPKDILSANSDFIFNIEYFFERGSNFYSACVLVTFIYIVQFAPFTLTAIITGCVRRSRRKELEEQNE